MLVFGLHVQIEELFYYAVFWATASSDLYCCVAELNFLD